MNKAITYHLEPGYIFVSASGDLIRTVVGSCVTVCLWDSEKMIGGMNHFLYPETKGQKVGTARYGNVAIPALLRMMKDMGCEKDCIAAQIYGGGKLHDFKRNNVGERNIEVARMVLKKKEVRVISEDVGGIMGRKILFDTRTGETAVLKVHRLRLDDWIAVPGPEDEKRFAV